MRQLIKEQNFGVEIELTGITRCDAAKVIAAHYHSNSYFLGGSYRAYAATDSKGRTWKAMSDGSIQPERKVNGNRTIASDDFKCEVVTPVLQYEDIEDLQQIVRELVAKGALANKSCGIHIHVDGAKHTPETLTRLLTFAIGRQDLFYEALQNEDRARWCRKINRKLLSALKHDTEKTRSSIERIWYSAVNDGYCGGIDHQHYNSTRYHGINLHAFFTKGTVEFRLFNGTTHAGKIKAYIQFCLAMSAWAIECESNDLYFKSCAKYTDEQKAALMKRVLTKRLGLAGPEFKTCRLHLTSVWKHDEEQSEVA